MSWYDYVSIAVVVLIFGGWAGIFIYLQKWKELRRAAIYWMEQAERIITGTKRGRERFEHVLDILYNFWLPGWMKWFIDEKTFREQLQEWYIYIKDYLSAGVKH